MIRLNYATNTVTTNRLTMWQSWWLCRFLFVNSKAPLFKHRFLKTSWSWQVRHNSMPLLNILHLTTLLVLC